MLDMKSLTLTIYSAMVRLGILKRGWHHDWGIFHFTGGRYKGCVSVITVFYWPIIVSCYCHCIYSLLQCTFHMVFLYLPKDSCEASVWELSRVLKYRWATWDCKKSWIYKSMMRRAHLICKNKYLQTCKSTSLLISSMPLCEHRQANKKVFSFLIASTVAS